MYDPYPTAYVLDLGVAHIIILPNLQGRIWPVNRNIQKLHV